MTDGGAALRGWPRLPSTAAGMKVGLFGGTFNPPHAGHLLVAQTALRAGRLDRIWWMVSPGNPLKRDAPPPIAERIAASKALARNPRILVTDVEQEIGVRFTVESVERLQSLRPRVRFVYVMGADSFATLHKWRDWQRIMERIPIIVVDRPGATLAAIRSVAGRRFAACRLPMHAASGLALIRPPAWVMVYGPRSALSSTALRQRAMQRGHPD